MRNRADKKLHTDRQADSYIPPEQSFGGYKKILLIKRKKKKNCGKRRNDGYQCSLLFPQSFQILSWSWLIKLGIVNTYLTSYCTITRLLKMLWKKEKMMITSIFSFPTMLPTLSMPNYNLLYTNPFHPFPNMPWFLDVCSTSLLKTLLSNFSFYQCFLPA